MAVPFVRLSEYCLMVISVVDVKEKKGAFEFFTLSFFVVSYKLKTLNSFYIMYSIYLNAATDSGL